MASSVLLEAPTHDADAIEGEHEPDALPDGRELNEIGFTRLLAWLDGGVDSHGETYLEMRRRLTAYFNRRNRPFADDLADETLSRIGRTLEQDGAITVTPQARYCYVVARFVLLEDVRREHRYLRRYESVDDNTTAPPGYGASSTHDERLAEQEARMECLDRSLLKLDQEQRALIVEYYRDRGQDRIARRRNLAKGLGITMNALGIRVCRIRAALEAQMAVFCGRTS